jgi:hypothetical protein
MELSFKFKRERKSSKKKELGFFTSSQEMSRTVGIRRFSWLEFNSREQERSGSAPERPDHPDIRVPQRYLTSRVK